MIRFLDRLGACILAVAGAAVFLALLGGVSGRLDAASPTRTQDEARTNNCFWQLAQARGRDLVCDYPTWLADKEREDLRRLTREMLQDARCTVSIKIARALVVEALTAPDLVFEAPPQPVVCEIVTKESVVPIKATFAPRVVIKDGVAVDATPGMANVTGVNGYLAWPVIEYVNRSETVKIEMLSLINAYLMMRVSGRG